MLDELSQARPWRWRPLAIQIVLQDGRSGVVGAAPIRGATASGFGPFMAEVGGVAAGYRSEARSLVRMRSLAQMISINADVFGPISFPVAGCVPASSRHSAGGWTGICSRTVVWRRLDDEPHGRRRDCFDGKARWSRGDPRHSVSRSSACGTSSSASRLDVIIEAGLALLPFGVDVRRCWERLQGRSVCRVEQGAPARAQMPRQLGR